MFNAFIFAPTHTHTYTHCARQRYVLQMCVIQHNNQSFTHFVRSFAVQIDITHDVCFHSDKYNTHYTHTHKFFVYSYGMCHDSMT